MTEQERDRDRWQDAAILERGKILAFLHQARAACETGNGPVQLVIEKGGREDHGDLRDQAAAIAAAVIDGLMEAIEQGLHSEARVEIVRIFKNRKETMQ